MADSQHKLRRCTLARAVARSSIALLVLLTCPASAHALELRMLMAWSETYPGVTEMAERFAHRVDQASGGEVTLALTGPDSIPAFEQLLPVSLGIFDLLFTHGSFHLDTTGIGILTEPPYFVVDIDGEEGAAAWLEIVGEADFLPTDWVSKTSRGLHLWYADTKPRASRRLGNKLDFKAVGGYVAAPPSLHPDGHRYWWMRWPSEGAVMEAPQGLIDLLDRGDLERERAMVSRVDNKPIRHVQFEAGKWWATWGFDGVYAAVRDAGEGNRNRLLYWAAFTLVEDGATDEDFDDLNQAALDAGLTARETRLTIRSARRAAEIGRAHV